METHIFQDVNGYYRYKATDVIRCDENGDIWIVISKTVFETHYKDVTNADMAEYIRSLITENFNIPINSDFCIKDLINESFYTYKDDLVCFKTGLYDNIGGVYTRNQHTNDLQFTFFTSLINEDLSNYGIINIFEQ